MENKNITISDKCGIVDTINADHNEKPESNPPIKGVISIYDKDGHLVKRVNNMVVNGGRYLLYGLFLNHALYGSRENAKNAGIMPTTAIKITNNDADDKIIEKFISSKFTINFSYAVDTIKTTTDLTISDIEAITSSATPRSFQLDMNDVNSGVTVEANPFDLKITFKSTIRGSDRFQKFNQIYLTYKLIDADSEDSQAILFSRVIMDPVFIGADGEYSIYYSLFF